MTSDQDTVLQVLLEPGLPVLVTALVAGGWLTWRARSPVAAVYAFVVLMLTLPPVMAGDAAGGAAAPRPLAPADALLLVAPEAWDPLPGGAENLLQQALRPAPTPAVDPEPRPGRLHVGLTALCLACVGLFGLRGRGLWTARLLFIIALLLTAGVLGPAPAGYELSAWVVLHVALAMLAGLALASLEPLAPEDSAASGVALGSLVVVVAAGLMGFAAWAGSADPRELWQPLIERIQARGPAAPEPGLADRQQTAGFVVTVADRAALAALAAMTALLLHLKGRRWPTQLLVVLATLAELLSARFGLPGL